jgi:hypothetical protein
MLRAMIRLLAVCVLCSCATAPVAGFSSYPLEELQALDAQEAWNELLSRALEVAPSKRDAQWQTLLDHAAIAKLAALEVTDQASASTALRIADELMVTYPSLHKSRPYLDKRVELNVVALPMVLESRQTGEWLARITKLAEHDAVTPRLAQRLATEVVGKRLIPSTGLPLWFLALKRDGAEKVCGEPGLSKAVMEVVADGAGAEVKDLVMKTCQAQLRAPVMELVKTTDSRTVLLRVCPLLAGQAEAAELVKSKCPGPVFAPSKD